MLVPAAGGTPVPIAGTVGAQDGSISPDGKLAVFSIAPGGSDTLDAGIYTVPVGGGTPTSIVATPDNATDSLPVLSPDQTQVAFVRDGVDGNGDEVVALEVQPVAGGTVRQLATDVTSSLYNGGRLSFSPDGKTIAYAGAFDNPGIFTASRRERHRLAADLRHRLLAELPAGWERDRVFTRRVEHERGRQPGRSGCAGGE